MPKLSEKEASAPTPKTTVRLKNRSPRLVCFNLPCNQFCKDAECVCQVVEFVAVERNYQTGEDTKRLAERKICTSLTLLAGEVKEVSNRVLNVAEIASAIERRDLVVVG